jgi:DHA2 family multidrug resistance protein
MVDQQAFMLAANDVFYGSSIIFLMLIPLVWLSRPALSARAATIAPGDPAASAH